MAMTVPQPAPWWDRGWLWLVLALASTLPFVVAPLPMLPDYFSHIGRYHVMNHGAESAYLRQYYEFRWALIGNLGVDLLMVPLGRVLPTETAATICAAGIPPLTLAGIFAVARTVWGRVQAPALLALPFVYSFTFLFGFVNYHLALALALLAFALWVRAARWPPALRTALFLAIGAALWVAHIAGWAVLLLLISCWEFVTARRMGSKFLPSVVTAARRTLPVALPLAALVIWRSGNGGTSFDVRDLRSKLDWLTILLRSEHIWTDIATVLLLGVAGWWLYRKSGAARDGRLLFAALMLALCFLVLPKVVFGSFYADGRLLPVFAIVLFVGLGTPAGRVGTIVALLGVGIFAARLAMTTVGWQQRGSAAVADLEALDSVPRGSRIAVMSSPTACEDWHLKGFDHLASLAIVRREAFVNTQWDIAGSQLLRPLYNRGRGFNDAISTRMAGKRSACDGTPLPQMLAGLPRDRFDYVWVFDDAADAPWLRPVFAGPHGRLYRIEPRAQPLEALNRSKSSA